VPKPDKRGMSVLIGFGKPGAGEDDSSDMDPKEAAGLELVEALGLPADKADGRAVCEAVKNLIALEGYGSEDDEEEESDEAAE
jgi:hypothetical protein